MKFQNADTLASVPRPAAATAAVRDEGVPSPSVRALAAAELLPCLHVVRPPSRQCGWETGVQYMRIHLFALVYVCMYV